MKKYFHTTIDKFKAYVKNYWIFFLLGAVTAFSQAPFNFIWASFLGFSGLFYIIISKKYVYQKTHIFWAGHSFGVGYFFISLHWIGNALLTDLTQFAIFLPFAYLGLPIMLGIFYAISLYIHDKCTTYLKQKHNINSTIISYIIFIFSLGISDYLRGTILTGFPWNLPVYTTVSIPILMQPSYLFGIYIYNIIWLLLAGSFSLYFLKHKYHTLQLIIIHYLSISILAIYGYYHFSDTNDETLLPSSTIASKTIIRIIQPNISQKLKWSAHEAKHHFNKLIKLSQKNLDQQARYIFIWPETAMPFNPEHDFAAASRIIDLLNNKHILISGKIRFIEDKYHVGNYQYYNSIFKFTPDGKVQPVFDKVHLVPFGEYLPLRFILEKFGFSQINFFQSSFSTGKNFQPFTLIDNIKAGGLICYEAIFPQYSKIIKKNQAQLIINLTNDAWFGNSFGPYQHLVQTQFRSVENNISIIRSANTGISSFINKKGQIIKKLPLNKADFLDINITQYLNITQAKPL